MTRGEFFLAIRERAEHGPRPRSVERAVITLVGLGALQGNEARAIGNALLGMVEPSVSPQYGTQDLDALSPLAIGALDVLLEALLCERLSVNRLRELMCGTRDH